MTDSNMISTASENLVNEVIIKQTWFHVEAIYYPHPCHRVRHVMDVLIPKAFGSCNKDNKFIYPIPKPFSELRVYARNDKRNEIAFIEVSNGILLSPQYNNLPIIEENGLKYHHLKMEVEYLKIDIGVNSKSNPIYGGGEIVQVGKYALGKYGGDTLKSINLRKRAQMFLGDFWRSKFNVNLIFYVPTPEIYLTLPPYWRLGDISVYKDHLNPNKSEGSHVDIAVASMSNTKGTAVSLEDTFISRVEGVKRKYSIVISEMNSMEHINSADYLRKFSDDPQNTYSTLHYVSEMSTTITIFSLFPPIGFIILSYSVGISTYSNLIVGDSEVNILGVIGNCVSFSIVYLAYCYTYITLKDKGYDIPHRLWYRTSSLAALLTILLCVSAIIMHLLNLSLIILDFNIMLVISVVTMTILAVIIWAVNGWINRTTFNGFQK